MLATYVSDPVLLCFGFHDGTSHCNDDIGILGAIVCIKIYKLFFWNFACPSDVSTQQETADDEYA